MIYSTFSTSDIAKRLTCFFLVLLRKTGQSWKIVHSLLSMGEDNVLCFLNGEGQHCNNYLQTRLVFDKEEFIKTEIYLNKILEEGWSIAYIGSDKYPKQWLPLGNDAPPIMFFKGKFPLDNTVKTVAVVGTTKPSQYMAKLVSDTVQFFVQHGFSHISGGAVGVDCIGHETVLSLSGFTRVILPCGIFCFNIPPLWEEGIQNGNMQLISPWLPDADWLKSQAVRRNQLIATLAHVGCVFQPSHAGGSLSVARNLLMRGLPVFVYNPQGFAKILDYLPKVTPLLKDNHELNYPELEKSLNIEIETTTHLPKDLFNL